MTEYRIVETGQRLNGAELDAHLLFGVWTVVDRDGETWTVRDGDGDLLTVAPVGS
ncbi:hypothetical protein [Haloarcula litorea]|uniref:hypothetical protein n=1 Tax=Haloarcula litorea TaxID=3032579 RepID=UPI0023E81F56|nr:hypothetical protein [Halomicroarcula sp. GDY20]